MESIVDVKKTHKVLIVGVGRSNVIDVLYENGFREIVGIDVSPILIAQLQSKYSKYSGIECITIFTKCHWIIVLVYVMDARELHMFQEKTFSIVIDKGTQSVYLHFQVI